jgi:hypothetical protein
MRAPHTVVGGEVDRIPGAASGSGDAPPVPLVPALGDGRKRRQLKESYAVIIDGNYLGDLRWNESGTSLDVHCGLHTNCHCQFNRTIVDNKTKPQQGRPLGTLVAWLIAQRVWTTRRSHFDARLGKTDLAKEHLSFEKRIAARRIVEACPRWAAWTAAVGFPGERPKRGSEEIEPEGLC